MLPPSYCNPAQQQQGSQHRLEELEGSHSNACHLPQHPSCPVTSTAAARSWLHSQSPDHPPQQKVEQHPMRHCLCQSSPMKAVSQQRCFIQQQRLRTRHSREAGSGGLLLVLELGHKGNVIGRPMLIGQTAGLVLLHQALVRQVQQRNRHQRFAREEDIVQRALEVLAHIRELRRRIGHRSAVSHRLMTELTET